MKKLITLLIIIPLLSFGQKNNDTEALKLCLALQSNNFTSDNEAENAIDKIMSVIGTSQKPILQACNNINNAVAAVYKGQRYILYDRKFIKSLTSGSNKYWSNMFILAHEIGHYKKNHIIFNLLFSIIQTGIMLYILSLLIYSFGGTEGFLTIDMGLLNLSMAKAELSMYVRATDTSDEPRPALPTLC